ncbi:hypothetical protein [Paraclostridium dentum]|uniref:hypothetical protein n=1 Tax=Paraclostridium dentum TaxID=2662455 RepID=UPI003F3570C5
MTKAEFLNLIEEELNIRLTSYQLDYFFNNNIYRVMSTPRQAGKDFIAIMDLLYACVSEPGTRTLYCCTNKAQRKIFLKLIDMFVPVLYRRLGFALTNSTLNNGVEFNNTSFIRFINCDNGMAFRGQRVHKVVIMEPDTINPSEFENVLTSAMCSTGIYTSDVQLSVIGTHIYKKSNLLSCILNPYYYKIQAKREDMYMQYSESDLANLRTTMSSELYNLEISNVITPTMISSMFRDN